MLKNVIMRSHFSLSKTFIGFVHSPIGHAKHFETQGTSSSKSISMDHYVG
jgi:hypothetical protein